MSKEGNHRQCRGRSWKEKRAAILERDGHRCLSCGSVESLTVDHIVPLASGGTSDRDNLQTLCARCNLRKGVDVLDYRAVAAHLEPNDGRLRV